MVETVGRWSCGGQVTSYLLSKLHCTSTSLPIVRTYNPEWRRALTQGGTKQIWIGCAVAGYQMVLYDSIREAAQAERLAHTTVGYNISGRASKWEAHEWQKLIITAAGSTIENICMKQNDQGVPGNIETLTTFYNY